MGGGGKDGEDAVMEIRGRSGVGEGGDWGWWGMGVC